MVRWTRLRPWLVRLGVGCLLTGLLLGSFIGARLRTVRVVPPAGPQLEIPTATTPGRFPHSAFDAVLGRVVDPDGRVDYRALAGDRADLERYIVALQATSPHRDAAAFKTREDRLAYWLNAYNALVLFAVTERPRLRSVHDERYDFFGLTRYVLGGEAVSLHGLENAIIRREFREPRIHFALNCASTGCPMLQSQAFVPERLEAQLSAAARAFCADPKHVRRVADAVELSSIFDWYAADFAPAGGGIAFCRQYGRPDLPANANVRFIPYDWSLNAQRGRR